MGSYVLHEGIRTTNDVSPSENVSELSAIVDDLLSARNAGMETTLLVTSSSPAETGSPLLSSLTAVNMGASSSETVLLVSRHVPN